MKVKIGPYKNWVGPFQIAEFLCFWARKEKDEYGYEHTADWVHNFGEWLSGGEKEDSWLMKLCVWIESRRQRTIKVRIDPCDTWSMNTTLAYIILPMLKQLNESKQGAPCTDDEDVPEALRSTNAGPKENEWDTDDLFFKRWDWIMSEMIFAFEHKIDDSWEEKFYTGEWDMKTVPVEHNGQELYTWEPGPDHTYTCDREGLKAVHDRIQNGFRLFGRYYQNLWD